MPHVEKHAPGSFNWIELATTDQAAAKAFYGQLLGWEAVDYPMGPDSFYTMFKIDRKDAGACFSVAGHSLGGQTIPPNWSLYVCVESADAAAARAEQMEGKVLRPPFDVFTFGRMAVIQDPTGAALCLWEVKTHIGTGITGVNGTLCWADLNTSDPPKAKAFYEKLFGWQILPGKDKPANSYLHIKNGEVYIGGMPPASERNSQAPHWLVYFQVADCDASTAKAKELGAKIYVPPMSPEPGLRFSVVADPQGAVFALFTPQH